MALDKDDVRNTIQALIAQSSKIDKNLITDELALEEDLGLDSLDTIELLIDLDDQYKINIVEDVNSDITVGELIEIVSKYEYGSDEGEA